MRHDPCADPLDLHTRIRIDAAAARVLAEVFHSPAASRFVPSEDFRRKQGRPLPLSPRQTQVRDLLAEGKRPAEIARTLNIASGAVSSIKAVLRAKDAI